MKICDIFVKYLQACCLPANATYKLADWQTSKTGFTLKTAMPQHNDSATIAPPSHCIETTRHVLLDYVNFAFACTPTQQIDLHRNRLETPTFCPATKHAHMRICSLFVLKCRHVHFADFRPRHLRKHFHKVRNGIFDKFLTANFRNKRSVEVIRTATQCYVRL